MRAINRSVYVVRFREPYVSWACSFDDVAPEFTQRLSDYVSIYLAPEDPTGRYETPPLKDFFTSIFEHELGAWRTDESRWPEDRSFAVFREWFEVTGQSMVWDLGTESIVGEDFGRRLP